jgi:hypothetical protein
MRLNLAVTVVVLGTWLQSAQGAPAPEVKLVTHADQHQVEVLVDGKPFTTYRWEADLKKPLLYPLRTEAGGVITRGFPLDPRPGDPTDHPHHIGFWLNYGNVAGLDFWNNSVKAKNTANMGTVVHKSIRTARGGRGHGELAITADWTAPDGKALLREDTELTFSAGPGRRAIDRDTTLTAVNGAVDLPDDKEGVVGLRVAHILEHPTEKNPTGTGHYRTSEGVEGEAVWGTRGRWCMLTGKLEDGSPVTVALLDHPGNPGFPTYWHARPWGLFAANPLGQKALSKGKDTLNFSIPKGGKARFDYRLVILSHQATPEEMEAEYKAFAGEPAGGGAKAGAKRSAP